MITLRKLSSLPDGTRRRKTARLLRSTEEELSRRKSVDPIYLRGLIRSVVEDPFWDAEIVASAEILVDRLADKDIVGDEFLRSINDLRHRLLTRLGDAPADWDFTPGHGFAAGGGGAESSLHIHPIRIYLDDLRSPFNVGSVFRSAAAFGAERLWLSRSTASPTHPRARRSSMGAVETIQWDYAALPEIAPISTGRIMALELGGADIREFDFPAGGTVILGSEELGIRPETRRIAEESLGLVSIPLEGFKRSLNVAVALGILLERWTGSLMRAEKNPR